MGLPLFFPLLHHSITPFPHPRAWNLGESRQYDPDDGDSCGAHDSTRNRRRWNLYSHFRSAGIGREHFRRRHDGQPARTCRRDRKGCVDQGRNCDLCEEVDLHCGRRSEDAFEAGPNRPAARIHFGRTKSFQSAGGIESAERGGDSRRLRRRRIRDHAGLRLSRRVR